MKKTLALTILVIMLSVVTVNVSNAFLDIDKKPTREDPIPDWHCVCETMYCDCVYDCGTPYASCLVARGLMGAPPWEAYDDCQKVLDYCKKDCEDSWGYDIEYTCYGLDREPTPQEIISGCLNTCLHEWGLTRMECYETCDMI